LKGEIGGRDFRFRISDFRFKELCGLCGFNIVEERINRLKAIGYSQKVRLWVIGLRYEYQKATLITQ